jgi:hypothetical protein
LLLVVALLAVMLAGYSALLREQRKLTKAKRDLGRLGVSVAGDVQTLAFQEDRYAESRLAQIAPVLNECGGPETLFVTDSRLSDEQMSIIASWPRLKQLFLASTGMGDEGARRLAASPSLEEIDIIDLPISDAGLEALAKCPSLKKLRVYQTSVSTQCAERLRGERSELLIVVE